LQTNNHAAGSFNGLPAPALPKGKCGGRYAR